MFIKRFVILIQHATSNYFLRPDDIKFSFLNAYLTTLKFLFAFFVYFASFNILFINKIKWKHLAAMLIKL